MSGQSSSGLPARFGLRAAAFLLAFAALQLGWQSLHGSRVERLVIHDGIVRPAVILVNVLTPRVGARAAGDALQAPGGGLFIRNGCDGLEAMFLLCAAFLVAPMSWRKRWQGLLLGTAFVYVVNQVRILILFYAFRADRQLFDSLHATVTPIAVVLLICTYFYAWQRHAARPLAQAT